MRRQTIILSACVSFLALGSVVALAQAVPPAPASEGNAPELVVPLAAESEPDVRIETAESPSIVEDAPIDVPTSPQAEWAPDINLDAIRDAEAAVSSTQRKARPRKILSDAGENVLGTGSWSSANNGDAGQAQLLSRANRRERAIDPLKRSDLTKLSRVMGALHALRVSCAGRDDQTYRSRMATMLDLEAPSSGGLRDPLVDAFNGGFQAYGRGASDCPADARVQEASLAKDGYSVARAMSMRYRPPPKAKTELPPATQPRQNVPQPTVSPASPKQPQPAQARASWNKMPTE
jgi:uncharacterized protein (TIGR02301 family)